MFYGQPQRSNPNQVYFDSESGRYYTQTPSYNFMGNPFGGGERTFLDDILGQGNKSQVQEMLANRQPYQYNAPTAQQMFPNMQQPMMGGMQQPMQSPFGNMFSGMQSPSLNMGSMGQGNQGGIFGAGRFLGGQGLLGNSTSTIGT